jgi:hypothetical protein
MKTSHAGLRISEPERDASVEYTRQAMKHHNVGAREADEVIAIVHNTKVT